MQDLTINIPFNRAYFLEANKIPWALSYQKTVKSYILYTLLAACALIAGLLGDGSVFPATSAIGGAFLFYMILAWSGFFEKRSNYYKQVYQQANEYDQAQMDSIYTFSGSGIQYSDKEKLFRFNWHLLKPFTIYQNHILISLKSTNRVFFIIGEKEVSEHDYLEIQRILTEKCPRIKVKSHLAQSLNLN